MHFVKLRLSGFKSFVEPTEVPIEPGLSGIVGPNGCGKSNLVEALRWVMGETRAKQMRGGEMEDVIFNGTDHRPQRSLAEVSLLIDNGDRKAPAPFNDGAEIEIVRQIERGAGSTYRVQGREVRARDVQLLFADAATGAQSPSLVSQGRIGELINAKPTARRVLLEEAAGIFGLHSRRHEAELRLRAAEANLARLDDVLTTLDTQFQGLRKQARQAARYRNLSQLIRRAEAMVLHRQWELAALAVEAARETLATAEMAVAERTERAAEAARVAAEAEADLPAERRAEAEAAAEVASLAAQRDRIEAEGARIAKALAEAAERLAQIDADLGREQGQLGDAEAAVARLQAESETLALESAAAETALAEATAALEAAQAALETSEALVSRLTEESARHEAERAAATRELAELDRRAERLARREEEIRTERDRLAASLVEPEALQAAEAAQLEAEAALGNARGEAERAATERQTTQAAVGEARETRQSTAAELARLSAEIAGLGEALAQAQFGPFAPILDRIAVTPGYEAALGAAFGDDLTGSTDPAAPARWRLAAGHAEPAPLPAGTEPLSRYVSGPVELSRRLDQIAVIDDGADLAAIADQLAQGQRLVSRGGALWRWDGFTLAAGAPSAAALRLSQRNRLHALEATRIGVEAAAAAARDGLARREAAATAAIAADEAARHRIESAVAALAEARSARAALESRAAAASERLATLNQEALHLVGEREGDARRRAEVAEQLAAIPDPAAGRARLEEARLVLVERRGAHTELKGRQGRLGHEQEARARRLEAIGRESAAWTSRAENAGRQIAVLGERRQQVVEERQRLERRPAEIAAELESASAATAHAEVRRAEAAERVAAREAQVAAAVKALKAIEADLMAAREERVRAESELTHAEGRREEVASHIRDQLAVAPEEALAAVGVKPEQVQPEVEQLQTKLDRLLRERDGMGPVNLRAEQEADAVQEQINGLNTEKNDLVGAIAKLRQGISSLNREGRERLLAAFTAVNNHFQTLFVRLFGGGRAYLELAEADDPLEAGLEVYASPPGKKLQALSLLSGGEQALTALSLLFAVFLANPAPICVLDEVDAPLDDANVDRFCNMLEDMARETSTRFLVVSHHRLTMARMDRLFGVTMVERGVSQLVSVDLQQAVEMRATA